MTGHEHVARDQLIFDFDLGGCDPATVATKPLKLTLKPRGENVFDSQIGLAAVDRADIPDQVDGVATGSGLSVEYGAVNRCLPANGDLHKLVRDVPYGAARALRGSRGHLSILALWERDDPALADAVIGGPG